MSWAKENFKKDGFSQEIIPHSHNSSPDVKKKFDSHLSMQKTPTQ